MRSARTSLMPALSALLALLLLVTSTATPALAATYAAPLRSIPTAYAPTPGAPASQAYASLDESRFTSKSMSGSGVFLQRDPAGYEDSVNIYAGMKHDPVNNRDPTGARIRVADRKAQELLDRLANDALGHELIAYVRASPIEFVIYGEADLPRGVHGVTGNLAPELTPGRFPETDHERIGEPPPEEFEAVYGNDISIDIRLNSRAVHAFDATAPCGGPTSKDEPGGLSEAENLGHELIHAALYSNAILENGALPEAAARFYEHTDRRRYPIGTPVSVAQRLPEPHNLLFDPVISRWACR